MSNPTETNGPKKTSGYYRKGADWIVWLLLAPFRLLVWLIRLADEHSGFVTAAATIAIAVLTYVYVDYSGKQWQVAVRALEVNRAWLFVGQVGWGVEPGGSPVVTAMVRNVGRSPALKVGHRILYSFEERLPPLPPLDQWGSLVTMSTDTSLTTQFILQSISPSDVKAVLDGSKPLFLWVALAYADPFGGDRLTVNCVYYDAATKTIPICKRFVPIYR